MPDAFQLNMAKKKREHIVFDRILKPKKSIPFSAINKIHPLKKKDKNK